MREHAAARFATTRWSLVLAAGRRSNARSTEALASLCETYWYPVYAVIRRQGYGVDEARDLTQGFFARPISARAARRADAGTRVRPALGYQHLLKALGR